MKFLLILSLISYTEWILSGETLYHEMNFDLANILVSDYGTLSEQDTIQKTFSSHCTVYTH